MAAATGPAPHLVRPVRPVARAAHGDGETVPARGHVLGVRHRGRGGQGDKGGDVYGGGRAEVCHEPEHDLTNAPPRGTLRHAGATAGSALPWGLPA
ncbi:hypothetical protein SHKM778_92530 [Streptomyces sp. KM77-8]|uniref:Uncharacterized protein n=1 Tax=Streptomyces haneummycinicus TaxID=3074435 RepID=A0AAT9I036_9ACTN